MIVKIGKCLNCEVGHEWEFDGATLKELRTIKKLTGYDFKSFAAASDEGDPEALAALLYVLHKRGKIEVPFDDIDLDFTDFDMVLTAEEQEASDRLEKAAEKAGKEALAAKNGRPPKAA
jgi:hypothetical protein